jgi:hypothetical protein
MGKILTEKCACWGEHAILFVKDVPICPKCDDEREAKTKREPESDKLGSDQRTRKNA